MSASWMVIETLQEWNTLCGWPDRADHVPSWECPQPLPVLARRRSATTVEIVLVTEALALIVVATRMNNDAAIAIARRDQRIAELENKLAAVRAMVTEPK